MRQTVDKMSISRILNSLNAPFFLKVPFRAFDKIALNRREVVFRAFDRNVSKRKIGPFFPLLMIRLYRKNYLLRALKLHW